MRRSRSTRADFRHFATYPTRWRDNDVYGHVNNAVFYEYADTLVNDWLIGPGGLAVPDGPVACIVAETGCRFHASLAYPEPVEAGLAVGHVGTSSIRFRIGLFAPGGGEAAADVDFVHVCVDHATRRPVPIPPALRGALGALAP